MDDKQEKLSWVVWSCFSQAQLWLVGLDKERYVRLWSDQQYLILFMIETNGDAELKRPTWDRILAYNDDNEIETIYKQLYETNQKL